MTPTTTPLMPGFAAVIAGADVATASELDVEAIKAASIRYPVLVLRDQKISEEAQVRFASMFGPLDVNRAAGAGDAARSFNRGLREELLNVGNAGNDLKPLPATDSRRLIDMGNKLWHTDSTFKPIPAHLSMLYGIKVTREGGETQFADLRAGYDALSADMKTLIDGLVAEHSAVHARAQLGFDDFPADLRANLERKWAYPLVRTLPETGRKSLYLAAHAASIVGLSVPVGRMLLHELIEHATTQNNVYTHVWRTNDFVIWDNRCTMHRVRRYKASEEARVLRRVSTQDPAFPAVDPATVKVPHWAEEAAA